MTGHLQGFCTAVGLNMLQAYLVTPQDLAVMVCGTSATWQNMVQLQDIFHVVMDSQLQQECTDLAACLWEVRSQKESPCLRGYGVLAVDANTHRLCDTDVSTLYSVATVCHSSSLAHIFCFQYVF